MGFTAAQSTCKLRVGGSLCVWASLAARLPTGDITLRDGAFLLHCSQPRRSERDAHRGRRGRKEVVALKYK